MRDIFGFLFSPHGIALLILIWAMKFVLGLWIAGKAILLLPVDLQARPRRWLDALTPGKHHRAWWGQNHSRPRSATRPAARQTETRER